MGWGGGAIKENAEKERYNRETEREKRRKAEAKNEIERSRKFKSVEEGCLKK